MPIQDEEFWAPRRCFLPPIDEIYFAQGLLDAAAEAHLEGEASLVAKLLVKADLQAIGDWTQSIWGWGANKERVVRFREVPGLPPRLPGKHPVRMPPISVRRAMIERDGWHCRFCGIPLVGKEARDAILLRYPGALRWTNRNKNAEQHWAFQCMWAQYDHLVPHARGGDSSLENMVLTCAPCNFGRADLLLEEVGIVDPRTRTIVRSGWDGLERFLREPFAK